MKSSNFHSNFVNFLSKESRPSISRGARSPQRICHFSSFLLLLLLSLSSPSTFNLIHSFFPFLTYSLSLVSFPFPQPGAVLPLCKGTLLSFASQPLHPRIVSKPTSVLARYFNPISSYNVIGAFFISVIIIHWHISCNHTCRSHTN